jgi:hypothetical protein
VTLRTALRRVLPWGKAQGFVSVEEGATKGATVGEDLRWPDGSVVTQEQLTGQASSPGGPVVVTPPSSGGTTPVVTLWSLIQNIPANIVALAALAGVGLVARLTAGGFALRTITGTAGRIGVTQGDGDAGNPTIDLAELADSGTGSALVKITRDAYGRVSGTTPVVAADIEALGITGSGGQTRMTTYGDIRATGGYTHLRGVQ